MVKKWLCLGKGREKPNSMSWEVAAGAVTPWLTAYNLVTHLLGDKIGETVMVQGASGAVGSLLVQFLKEQGKTVLTSASKRNEAMVRSLGADDFTPMMIRMPEKFLQIGPIR